MTILEVHADLGRVAKALERIADLLHRLAYPPPPAEIKVQQATLEDLHIVTPADVAKMEEEKKEFAARYGVMPDSEAMLAVLQHQWEQEHRGSYGNTESIDWRDIYARAQEAGAARPGPGRE
jgi:hypothetical protein